MLLTSLGVASCITLLRLTGILQSLEWGALDQLFRLRPLESRDERIVIVGISEADLREVGKWPIPDRVLSELLNKIHAARPQAIGLDIYRDLRVEPGHEELLRTYRNIPNLIGIEKIGDKENIGVAPPPILENLQQVGFNNVVVDLDGTVRRGLLYWTVEGGESRPSFALALALIYLKNHGIEPQAATVGPPYLQLGQEVFPMLQPYDGGYIRADAGGYQFLANFRGPAGHFRFVSMTDILQGRIDPSLLRDRIVLIGSTATSLKDFSFTPYSGGVLGKSQVTAGVELQANFISQILSAVLDGRPLIQVWADPLEILWILLWAYVGARLSWRFRSIHLTITTLTLAGTVLFGICYAGFLMGWWIPLVPPTLGLIGSAIAILIYLAHMQEELKRSKEFLQSVINAIPDPIFVKDRSHRWIVLNDAFCKLLGRPLGDLLEKSDQDFFPSEEADTFRRQDDLIFSGGEDEESEEQFTDIRGNSHLIATRRSLHKDAAGNIFLVGVIRDITERKRREQELMKTAYHDTLTGLPNRKFFYERFEQALLWAQGSQQLIALLFLDLDGFKQINDTLGHDMGDLLLKQVSQRLITCLRGTDFVSRLGGDEFTIILTGIRERQDVNRVAEKLLSALAQPFELDQRRVQVTTSIGVSIYPWDGEEMDTLIKNADVAMYHAKESGKNRYECARAS